MNSELVNFHLPTTGQFSAAVDNVVVGRPIGKVKQSLQAVLCPNVVVRKRVNLPNPRRSAYSADQQPMPRVRDR
jgi:hypothetical protein